MRTTTFCALACVLIGLAACGQPDRKASNSAPAAAATVTPAPAPTVMATAPATVPRVTNPSAVMVSYYMAASLQASVTHADLIVIGQINAIGGVINMRPDQSDPTKPATDGFGVGQVYSVAVERYLKGQGPAMLPLLQSEGDLYMPPTAVTQADIDHVKALYGVSTMGKGLRYLLVLNRETTPDGTTYYGGYAEPWRFLLTADGLARIDMPRDAYRTLPANFAPSDTAALLAQIEQLVKAAPSATPAT